MSPGDSVHCPVSTVSVKKVRGVEKRVDSWKSGMMLEEEKGAGDYRDPRSGWTTRTRLPRATATQESSRLNQKIFHLIDGLLYCYPVFTDSTHNWDSERNGTD